MLMTPSFWHRKIQNSLPPSSFYYRPFGMIMKGLKSTFIKSSFIILVGMWILVEEPPQSSIAILALFLIYLGLPIKMYPFD